MTAMKTADPAEVLAVLEHRDAVTSVERMAAVIARLVGGEVRQVRLSADLSPQQAAGQVVRALREPGAFAGVLAGDGIPQPLWRRVAPQSPKAVVLVPAGTRNQPSRIRRVLLPLDGDSPISRAVVAATAERFARGGAELVVLHVFDAETACRT